MFRRTSVQVLNKGGMWDESFTIYPLLRAESNITRLEWTFPPHGNRIRFGHMEHEKTRFDWQGAQIPYIGWDELTHFTEEQFFYMLSRNRSTCGVRPYVRATTNPDADSWVANFISWWIHPETGLPIPERAGKLRYFVRLGDQLHWASDPNELAPLTDGLIIPKSVTFIPANVHDNTILLDKDPGYLANLHALTNVERERLLGGNWKIRPASGLVFNRAWFQYVEARPYDAIARVRYWDKAGTEDGGKFTCGVLMSRTLDGRFTVEHVIRGQWASLAREKIIRDTARADGPDVNIYVEQEPGSGGKESAENLMANLAKKSPGVALKQLRRADDSPDRQRYLARMAHEKPWELLGLKYREELFCRELLATNENAYEAVLRVGTFKASTKGSRKNLASRLMKKPKIIARVAQLKREALAVVERKTRFKMSGERVLEKYASFINADIRRISPVDAHGMTIVPSDQWHEDDADAVKSISQTPDGMIKVELHSPIPALEFYARMFFPDQAPPMQGGVIVQQGVILIPDNGRRSEERRVGKECRTRTARNRAKKI